MMQNLVILCKQFDLSADKRDVINTSFKACFILISNYRYPLIEYSYFTFVEICSLRTGFRYLNIPRLAILISPCCHFFFFADILVAYTMRVYAHVLSCIIFHVSSFSSVSDT